MLDLNGIYLKIDRTIIKKVWHVDVTLRGYVNEGYRSENTFEGIGNRKFVEDVISVKIISLILEFVPG